MATVIWKIWKRKEKKEKEKVSFMCNMYDMFWELRSDSNLYKHAFLHHIIPNLHIWWMRRLCLSIVWNVMNWYICNINNWGFVLNIFCDIECWFWRRCDYEDYGCELLIWCILVHIRHQQCWFGVWISCCDVGNVIQVFQSLISISEPQTRPCVLFDTAVFNFEDKWRGSGIVVYHFSMAVRTKKKKCRSRHDRVPF